MVVRCERATLKRGARESRALMQLVMGMVFALLRGTLVGKVRVAKDAVRAQADSEARAQMDSVVRIE